jgi:lysophospholipase L1-like esterase
MKKSIFYIGFFLLTQQASAQLIPIDENNLLRQFPTISTVFNRVFNGSSLDSFYSKLYTLKTTGKGVVSIVHIGDSHIQADFLPSMVRNNLQDFFGNAGRGLIFPHQLAQSNAAPDISSSSNTAWEFNRIAHPEIPITPGISGFIIRSDARGAAIDLAVKGQPLNISFNRLRFFLDTSGSSSWLLHADNNGAPFLLQKERGDKVLYQDVQLEQNAVSFSLSSLPSNDTKEFYGVSLENSNPGVIYHTIGVNGSRYDQYTIANLFWRQLPALNADLYIISLGTNEAQRTDFNEATFQKNVTGFLQKLKQVSPNAAVLITTAADSYYKRKRPNAVLRSINLSLYTYCAENNLPIWDLYRITHGYGSAANWVRRGMMNLDRIHFTGEGYKIQGQLLFNALAKGYNNYVGSFR